LGDPAPVGQRLDRSLEAGTTAAFAIGPAGAIIGFAAGLIFGGKKRRRSREGQA
jgi:hypothetical protein